MINKWKTESTIYFWHGVKYHDRVPPLILIDMIQWQTSTWLLQISGTKELDSLYWFILIIITWLLKERRWCDFPAQSISSILALRSKNPTHDWCQIGSPMAIFSDMIIVLRKLMWWVFRDLHCLFEGWCIEESVGEEISLDRLCHFTLIDLYFVVAVWWWGMHIWGLVCQKQVSRTGTNNYIPQYLWDVIIRPCPWYLLLACKSPLILWTILYMASVTIP